MRWRKLGRVFGAEGQAPWFRGPAIVAIPRPLGGPLWRVFVSPRDAMNRSSVCWFDMDLRRPGQALPVSPRPVLEPGAPGRFDAAGAMGAWITEADGEERLYYQGWSLPADRPFHAAIGLAVRRLGDDRPFERLSDQPILEGAAGGFAANPAVLPDGQGGWRMWFQQGMPWARRGGEWLPRYAIAEARSADGLRWAAVPGAGMPWALPGEVAVARFCPWREGAGWRAAFSVRGDGWGYRLASARSADGRRWTRDAAPPLEATEPWEDGTLCYPTVFAAEGRRWMLFNAGRYGAAGLGLAVAE